MRRAHYLVDGYVYRATLDDDGTNVTFEVRTACDEYTECMRAKVRDGDIVREGTETASEMAKFFVAELLRPVERLPRTPPRGELRAASEG